MELLDPLKNRPVKTAPLPFQGSLQSTQLFCGDKVDFRLLMNFYQRQGKLSKVLYMELIMRAKSLFQKQPNVIRVEDPVTIVGDIHGQLYDLASLLEVDIGGAPQNTKYIFLGDYVDRGSFSIEVIGLLLALKLQFKDTVLMLRGNHECRKMTTSFNFRSECLQKYDQDVYQAIMDLFDCLPLAVIVNNKFLCIHGGISTAVQSLSDIERVRRFKEIPRDGALCDLV